MRVIFVSSGNSLNGLSPIVKNQGDSISKEGAEVFFFTIKGNGIIGYLSNLKRLRNYLKEVNPDIVHAHYSLSAIVATFAGAKPIVVSLMGSDVKAKSWHKFIIFIFYRVFWSQTIIKSEDMKKSLGFKKVIIIPNGVNVEKFKPIDKIQCIRELFWSENKTHILFAANPDRFEKNFPLAQKSVSQLNNSNIELHHLNNIDQNLIPIYFNAADVILLTSLWEGSPNVVKEAMACNCPVVATDVGDIRWLFGNEPGYFISDFSAADTASKITDALDFANKYRKTNGRQRIFHLGLDSSTVAKKIINIYLRNIKSETGRK